MSQIKFFALGGLGENGKNLYCLEINEKILVLDAGLKHPSGDLLGVDAIVPDIGYLEARKQDVIGILLSHAHDKHVGAIPMLIKTIPAPVFGTKYTIAVIKVSFRGKLPAADDMKFGIVVSEWNPEVTEALLQGAVRTLRRCGCAEHNILIKYVPGTFELALGAQFFAEYTDVDAVIALGCVIQGET
ncbi:MAG: 6,7-dimethyl-8-ribityllumazine synthase, partial [Candidatus Izemoplasmatales bacterium]|nr:6,7-dimethyl-8-ribityllumazine synthase [Candidatus Izemoplasmatales bacterium]